MPTGYTEILTRRDDVTFSEFALRCARAFGAFIEMRDDSLDAKLPEKFKPSDYHIKAIAKAQKELRRLLRMDDYAKLSYGRRKKNAALLSMKKSLDKVAEEDAKFESMSEHVRKWEPPTKDHFELKKFMLQQLDISKNRTDWYEKEIEQLASKEVINYYKEAVETCRRDIEYHTEEHKKEIDRISDRNKWVTELRKSLDTD